LKRAGKKRAVSKALDCFVKCGGVGDWRVSARGCRDEQQKEESKKKTMKEVADSGALEGNGWAIQWVKEKKGGRGGYQTSDSFVGGGGVDSRGGRLASGDSG